MEGSDTAGIIWYLAVLVLVVSALLSKRIEWRSAISMILVWVGIFALALIILSYRQELGMMVQRVASEVIGKPVQSGNGKLLRIRVASDGHYWVDGTVNGTPARFLIDSGATITALSASTAQAASLELDRQRAPITLNTANGSVEAQRGIVSSFHIGSIEMRDLPVVTSPAFGDVNIVGMNLLARLKSWRIENDEMILEP